MSFLSKLYQKVLYRFVDTTGHGRYVLDVFNDIHKLYLATCLRMCSTSEVDKIGSKSMRVHAMTEKGKVRFSKECKCVLEHHDEIGT